MTIPKYCILCENYKQHPCRCTHCEDFDEFIVSESGKHLLLTMNKQYEKVKTITELENIKKEFLDKCKNYYRFDNEIILNGFEELIDKYIEKLKGETNETDN